MTSMSFETLRRRIWRRIAVKTAVFGFWAVSMMIVMSQGGAGLADRAHMYMAFVIVAIWAVSTFRDMRIFFKAKKG